MKKSDLKDGIVLEYYSGRKVINIAGNFYFIHKPHNRDSGCSLTCDYDTNIDEYDEDLMEHDHVKEDRTVRRTYKVKSGFRGSFFQVFDDGNLELVWERKEPVKLTRYEQEILNRAYECGFKYIARDKDSRLFAYTAYPDKRYDHWSRRGEPLIGILTRASDFDFIKWEDSEPTNIQELLDNCEVVD